MPEPSRFHRAVLAASVLLGAVHAAWFGAYTCILHMRFKTFAYDLGTFDQGIWLAGHSTDHLVTVRGLPLLGDHVRLFSFVLAPLYWIVDDVRALLVLQSIVIGAGAFFVCRIALRLLPARPFFALALATSFLLHPANQNLNLDHAHPDAFAMTFILASLDFLGARRWVAFAIAAALAMSCKEDVPLVYAALGAVMMLDRRQRTPGFAIAAAASVYFVLCLAVILPWFNGAGFFRFGTGGFLQTLSYQINSPAWILERLTRPESMKYLLEIGATNLYAFLLAPLSVVPALPQIIANLLSDAHYMRNLEYHYHTSVIPFLYFGTAVAVAKIDGMRARFVNEGRAKPSAAIAGLLALAPVVFLGAAVAANLRWSRVPIRHPAILTESLERLRKEERTSNAPELLAMIPPDAIVAADYATLPHISHRRRIYMFPNPFEISNWGINGEHPHNPEDIEYIVLRKVDSMEPIFEIVDGLVKERQFRHVAGDEAMSLYQRIDLANVSPKATCADFDGDGTVTKDDQRFIGIAIMRGRECPLPVCDADGNGKLEYRDALVVGLRTKDPAAKLSCPPPVD